MIRKVLKNWRNISKAEKDERGFIVQDYLQPAIEWYLKEGWKPQNKDFVQELVTVMSDKKFIKTCKKLAKKDALSFDIGILISAVLEMNRKNMDDELVQMYIDILMKINKGLIKNVHDDAPSIPKEMIAEICAVTPDLNKLDDKTLNIFINKALRKLYASASALDSKTVMDIKPLDLNELFKWFYGKKNIEKVLLAIMLEREGVVKNFNEQQKIMYSTVTTFMLQTLNEMKMKDIEDIMERYTSIRRKQKEKGTIYSPRVSFAKDSLSFFAEMDYDKLRKFIEEVAFDGEFRNPEFL